MKATKSDKAFLRNINFMLFLAGGSKIKKSETIPICYCVCDNSSLPLVGTTPAVIFGLDFAPAILLVRFCRKGVGDSRVSPKLPDFPSHKSQAWSLLLLDPDNLFLY